MGKNTAKQKPIKIALGLQGGGSLGAYTAGVLTKILASPKIEITDITGTSAGAMNGMIVTQTINKHGYDNDGRVETISRLVNFWKDVATPPMFPGVQEFLNYVAMLNPHGARHVVTQGLMIQLENHVINPRALASGHHINLTINAVDENGRERLFRNSDINHQSLWASAAIQPHIHPSQIDGHSYIDGAYLGGSNPPIESLTKTFNKVDAIIFIMTNPPKTPITCRKQSDLKQDDLANTDGLILHQAYDHIAYLLNRRERGDKNIPPIHIIWPQVKKPYSTQDKQNTSEEFISSVFGKGEEDGLQFIQKIGSTLGTKSSHTLQGLKRQAFRFS